MHGKDWHNVSVLKFGEPGWFIGARRNHFDDYTTIGQPCLTSEKNLTEGALPEFFNQLESENSVADFRQRAGAVHELGNILPDLACRPGPGGPAISPDTRLDIKAAGIIRFSNVLTGLFTQPVLLEHDRRAGFTVVKHFGQSPAILLGIAAMLAAPAKFHIDANQLRGDLEKAGMIAGAGRARPHRHPAQRSGPTRVP